MSWDDDTTPDAVGPATVYESVEAFVTDFLAPTYAARSGTRACGARSGSATPRPSTA